MTEAQAEKIIDLLVALNEKLDRLVPSAETGRGHQTEAVTFPTQRLMPRDAGGFSRDL